MSITSLTIRPRLAASSLEGAPPFAPRVAGLDSLRILCALWVLFGHGSPPPLSNPFALDSFLHRPFRGLVNNLWAGPAAVIVFFVISGFCIHYPAVRTLRIPSLGEFYARRYLRIVLPIAAAIPLNAWCHVSFSLIDASVLWSLAAELIYYTMYPALLKIRAGRGSWSGLIVVAYLGAVAVAATQPSNGDYSAYGVTLNWALGLPCWLLGCVLAERVAGQPDRAVTSHGIWAWRFGVLAGGWLTSILRFHTPLTHPWTLNVFAILAMFWLEREIAYRRRAPPPEFLERAGAWSYSFYLMHLAARELFQSRFPPDESLVRWALLVGWILFVSWLFYWLCERPSHAFSRWAGRQFRSRSVHRPSAA